MSGEYGVSAQSEDLEQLIRGECEIHSVLVDSAATAAVGQVLQYDASGDNYVDYTSSMAAAHYVVCAEAKTLSGDTKVACIISGRVAKAKLDATAQADAEIETALLKHGIIPVVDNERLS